MTKETNWAVGIDLGTTYSCIAVVKNGKVEVIHNDDGDRTLPSWVMFDNGKPIVGKDAKERAIVNPGTTIFESKRFIGRHYDDAAILSAIPKLPFSLLKFDDRIKVKILGDKEYFIEEISACILQHLKKCAEDYLEGPVTEAVITVPAYFDNNQIRATMDAGVIAGLKVLRVLSEPTAAAVSLGDERSSIADNKTVLIYDLGGGTFDISIVRVRGETVDVLATNGDSNLGGALFDQRLIDFLWDKFAQQHGIKETIQNCLEPESLQNLNKAAEKAKVQLSKSKQAQVNVEYCYDGKHLIQVITRARFEELNRDLFEKTLTSVKNALDSANLSTKDIDEILLVGGSTRIPRIQDMLSQFFGGKTPLKVMNPDHTVARGAAIIANKLSAAKKERTNKDPNASLNDVTPLSLGVMLTNKEMSIIVPRNTRVPCKQSRIYTTSEDDQDQVTIEIYEGERKIAPENVLLGRFVLTGIKGARGSQRIRVTLVVDENRILTVTAEDKNIGSRKTVTLENQKGKLRQEEINSLIKKAELYHLQDQRERKKKQMLNELEEYVCYLENLTKDKKESGDIAEDLAEDFFNKCEETRQWQTENRNEAEFPKKKKELENYFADFLTNK